MVAYSKGMAVGTVAPKFRLPGVDGRHWSLEDFADAKALVVVFSCNHCPYVRASEDRLIAIQRDYLDRGVRLVAINSNDVVSHPEDSFENMKIRATEKHFDFPYLYDESQDIARAYDAACTPDVFVFDAKRKLAYNGRIDDNWQQESKVTRRELREALDAVLAGQAISFDAKPSMGCSIKWRT
jgi:peroxiredoxin